MVKKIFIILTMIASMFVINMNKVYAETIDEVMSSADSFTSTGEGKVGEAIDTTKIKNASRTTFDILLGVGIIVAVAVGAYLGVKLMISSAEEKAGIKELLVPYVFSCIALFGAFGIWKLFVELFRQF